MANKTLKKNLNIEVILDFQEKFSKKISGLSSPLNLGLKADKQLQNENHTEDWVLGSHPRDNGHVTH